MNSINLVVASLPRHFNCRYHSSESRAYDIYYLSLSVEKFVSIWWNIMNINSKNFCPSIFQKPSHPLPAAGGRSHRPLPGHSTAIIKSQNIRFADCLFRPRRKAWMKLLTKLRGHKFFRSKFRRFFSLGDDDDDDATAGWAKKRQASELFRLPVLLSGVQFVRSGRKQFLGI